MDTVVLPADVEAHITRAAEVLRRGGLVAFPTETVYGLGANALDADAVGRIFAAKGRPANNPLIVHVADVAQVQQLAAGWPEEAALLAERFWPGPLTLVLPRGQAVPDVVTAGGPTVAIRLPAHPVALWLLRETGLPIAAPSANRSNRLSPTRAEHVLRDLEGEVEVILDGGAAWGGIESTVVDLTRRPARLLRPGPITTDVLEATLGPIERPSEVAGDDGGALPSPGMLARHYAPRTPLECIAGAEERVTQLTEAGLRVAWVSHQGQPGVRVKMPAEASAYAAALYATLHELDNEGGYDRIVVEMPPAGEEWRAVRDRLRRAGG